MAINGAPRLLQPIIGGLIWFVCAILFRTTMKRSKAVVQERLEKTAMLRADPAYDWKPPVRYPAQSLFAVRLTFLDAARCHSVDYR